MTYFQARCKARLYPVKVIITKDGKERTFEYNAWAGMSFERFVDKAYDIVGGGRIRYEEVR